MFESIDGLSADRTLSRAAGNARRVKLAQAESLVLAAHWADLHGECPADHPEAPGRSLPGMERLVSLGGEGTPEVAEFAPAELASELGLSDGAGRHLMAEALDLRHRLPQLWAKVTAGEVRAYIARQVAGKTRDLDPAAAAHVDEKTCTYADTLSWGRLEPVVNAAIIAADPELAQAKADEEATRQGVFSGRKAEHGVKTMFIRARTADVNSLDAYVHAIADQLGVLGDSDCKDLRRAKALGYVHDPDAVWTLFNQPPAEEPADADEPPQSDPGPDPDDHDAEADPWDLVHLGDTGHEPTPSPEPTAEEPPPGEPHDDSEMPAAFRRPTPPTIPNPLRSVTLYLHLGSDVFLGLKPGVARYTGEGPISLDQAREILGHANVTIKPVIDLADMAPADVYEVPPRLKEAATLRTPTSCFPFASDPDPRVDIDHTIPYRHHPPGDQGGKAPPGQTRMDNLGGLIRRHHRYRTHGGWQVIQIRSGMWLWISPHGRGYLVDHMGTTRLGKLWDTP